VSGGVRSPGRGAPCETKSVTHAGAKTHQNSPNPDALRAGIRGARRDDDSDGGPGRDRGCNRSAEVKILGPSALAPLALALALLTGAAPARAYDNPYVRIPNVGESVRLDGSVGGAPKAWAFFQQPLLEEFLRLTIDAATANKPYQAVQNAFGDFAKHVLSVQNGTRASIEGIVPFDYDGRSDVEARVMVQGGDLNGKELWTTLGELTDDAGRTFVRK